MSGSWRQAVQLTPRRSRVAARAAEAVVRPPPETAASALACLQTDRLSANRRRDLVLARIAGELGVAAGDPQRASETGLMAVWVERRSRASRRSSSGAKVGRHVTVRGGSA